MGDTWGTIFKFEKVCTRLTNACIIDSGLVDYWDSSFDYIIKYYVKKSTLVTVMYTQTRLKNKSSSMQLISWW